MHTALPRGCGAHANAQARAEGGTCFAREDYAGAAVHYERCAALTPRDPPAWTNLAVCLLRLGRTAAALEAAQKAVALEPRFAKGWLRQGEAQVRYLFITP